MSQSGGVTALDFVALNNLFIYKLYQELERQCLVIANQLHTHRHFAHADQLKRATLSIGNYLAEGYGRVSTGERLMLLFVSEGSVQEVKNCLQSASNVVHVDSDQLKTLISGLTKLSIALIEFCNSILEADPDYTGRYRKLVEKRRAWLFNRRN